MTPMSPIDFKNIKYSLMNLEEKNLVANLILDINNKLSIINNYPNNTVTFSISPLPNHLPYPENILEYVSLSYCLEGWTQCNFEKMFSILSVSLEV